MTFLKNPFVVGGLAFLAGVVAEKKIGITKHLAAVPVIGPWLA